MFPVSLVDVKMLGGLWVETLEFLLKVIILFMSIINSQRVMV